jgi:hypothetical protein
MHANAHAPLSNCLYLSMGLACHLSTTSLHSANELHILFVAGCFQMHLAEEGDLPIVVVGAEEVRVVNQYCLIRNREDELSASGCYCHAA